MNPTVIKILVQQLLSNKGRKRLIKVVAFFLVLLFLPVFIMMCINPFSAFNSDKSNDPYTKVQKRIQSEKQCSIDIAAMRAIDTVLFKDSIDENNIYKRANKYYYTEKKVIDQKYLHDVINYPKTPTLAQNDIKAVQAKLTVSQNGTMDITTQNAVKDFQRSCGIVQTGVIDNDTWDRIFNNKGEQNIKVDDGKVYKLVEKTIYVAKTLDEVITALKKDGIKISDDDIKNIKELYQICLLDTEGNSDDYSNQGGDGGTYKPTLSEQQFVQKILEDVKRISKQYGLFTSVSLAQAIIESGCGNSSLSKKYNNLFGVKADSGWTGQRVRLSTKEDEGGANITIMADFRVYPNWGDSIEDHAKFLRNNSTYSSHGVFSATSYEQQAHALQAAGYATDRNYAAELIAMIKGYKLDQYDNQ